MLSFDPARGTCAPSLGGDRQLFSPLGDADILSSFEDGNPILCYDHSSLFSNLYQTPIQRLFSIPVRQQNCKVKILIEVGKERGMVIAHSSLFSNLYQNFHLTILLPNGDREEALNRRDIVTQNRVSVFKAG
jgi:hypothetical protein